ncbi:MAG: site-specific integrase [Lysinibacillus sp.]
MFERMMQEKVFVIDERNASYHTYTKIYPATIKTLLRKANKEFNVTQMNQLTASDIRVLLAERIEHYHKDKKFSESHNINSILSALKAFQKGVQTFNDIYQSWNTIDIDEIREGVKQQQIVRRGKSSSTMRATSEQTLAVIESLRSTGNKVKNRTLVINMAIIALATGARISSLYSLKKSDLDFDRGICHFKKAKGGKDYDAFIDLDLIEEVKRIVNDKRDDEKIFVWRKKNGQYMSLEKMTDTVQYYIKRATTNMYKLQRTRYKDEDELLTYETIQTNFTFHSFRKAYAFKRLVHYLDRFKTYADMRIWRKEVLERKPDILYKLNALYKRANKHRIENKRKRRDLKIDEYAVFAASLDLGHERNDVIGQFYADLVPAKKYLKSIQS